MPKNRAKTQTPGIKDLLGTPSSIIELVDAYYGPGNWEDPCPTNFNTNIHRDGLLEGWNRKSFIHPPYSKALKWAMHGDEQYKTFEAGNMDPEQIWLVFTHNEVGWYRKLLSYCDALVLIDHRVLFKDPRNNYETYVSMGDQGSTLFYMGNNRKEFLSYFSWLGQGLIKQNVRRAKV